MYVYVYMIASRIIEHQVKHQDIPAIANRRRRRRDQLPVNNDRFLLRLGVGDQHISDQQAVDRR